MELFIIAFVFGMVGLWGWSLVDLLGRPEHQWKAIDQDRTLWVLAILFLGLPGSIGYLAFVRPKLSRVGALPPMPAYPMLNAAPPPGWYPDPRGMPMMRWFDGRQWTSQTAPMGSVPMGGVPNSGYGPAPMGGVPNPGYGPAPTGGVPNPGYGQAPVPMAGPMVGPPPGAPPYNYPYPPA